MRFVFFTAAALSLVGAPAFADITDFDVAPDATWKHKKTSVQFPPKLDGFSREWAGDFGTGQTDILATYQDRASGTTATLYVFRAGLVDVPVWQDRVLMAMKESKNIGPVLVEQALQTSFTPRQGRGANSGYRFSAPSGHDRFSSTGFAMFPHDGWLIVVRMSSQTLTAQQLDQRIDSFVGAVPLRTGKQAYPAAEPIKPCANPLSFEGKAEQSKPDLQTLFLLAAFAKADEKPSDRKSKAPDAEIAQYCRDSDAGVSYGVYRQDDGKTDSYVMALGDSGTAITVGRFSFLGVLEKPAGDQYWPILKDTSSTFIFAPFDRLPSPAEVMQVIQTQNPVSSVTTDAKGETTITLPSPS
ncbi:hypothetical protein [Altererythrobacter fulvus]|uniref:hypothetical protein n=1 Tax=Caenibius fulvus TaxID=2126012 RepID=UPI0030197809